LEKAVRLDRNREDISRFLVHLTRDYKGENAKENLLNILIKKTIFARNAHCLVSNRFNQMGFNDTLKKEFNTVCFTETPLTQIKQLASEIKGRKIQLQPYGLVFWKENLFDRGASPAIYINAKGTPINKFLLDDFDRIFKGITTLNKFKKCEVEHYENIIHYYSLINIVSDKHDFLWEREWRYHGRFMFEYIDLVAIVAENPDSFEEECKKKIPSDQIEDISKIPIIDPDWTYEEVIEQLAISVWNKLNG